MLQSFFKICAILFVSLLSLSSYQFVHAQEPVAVESIKDYIVQIIINQDSSIRVEENITYDFGTAQDRHGIFRNIPYKYKARGGNFSLLVSNLSVTDESGKVYQFVRSQEKGEEVIKIGDPNVLVTGIKQYNISYNVRKAINYFDDHDELYWNAIGTYWQVPIQQSKVTVNLPASSTNAQCYIGALGSTETLCNITDNKKDKVEFIYAKPLAAGEGFTISVGMPAGTIAKPTPTQKMMGIIRDNGILGLPISVLAIMYYLWRKYGKDSKGKGTIVPQYDPPDNLPPLYMGALVDGKVDNRDISAEIIHLATLGLLQISKIETQKLIWFKGSDYTFTKIKGSTENENLHPQSQAIYNALFDDGDEVSLSTFKSDTGFGKSLMTIKGKVLSELTNMGYFRYNPNSIKSIFIVVGFVLGAGGAFLLHSLFGTYGVVSALLSGLIIISFAFIMPAYTSLGAEKREYILGLKKYLGVAEKDRLEFHNAPDKNPKRFEMLLPFAMALGVEKLWANQFRDIYAQKPGWYNDSSATTFNTAILSSSMNDFSGSVQSAAVSATSTASSGGSGFSGGGSGGGGGGGGGGSW